MHLFASRNCQRWSYFENWNSYNECKGKGSSLDIAPLTILDSGALQPRKWQLTGIDVVPLRRLVAAIARANGLIGPTVCSQQAYYTPQSTTLGLHPVIYVPNYMDHYLFTDPWGWGMDGWVGHVGWPIADCLTTKWSLIQLQCGAG